MKTKLLSILIPAYNERDCIQLLYERLLAVLENISCKAELVFVNDGSTDDTLICIQQLQEKDDRIAYVDLSRNFGKEAAICAGIDYIQGDALAIIDADLQEPPELLPVMLNEIENGYDDVYACRTKRRGETWLKKWSAKQYYRLLGILSDVAIQENTGDFRMLSRKAIDALRKFQEKERNMKGLFSYLGFRKKRIFYEREPRVAGNTKWNYFSLFNLAIKGWTSFSVIPLRIISFTGVTISLAAFVYLIKVFVKAVFWGDPIAGYPSLMCVILFLGGIILLALGIIGEYLGIIYNESKKRPLYFVNEYRKSYIKTDDNIFK